MENSTSKETLIDFKAVCTLNDEDYSYERVKAAAEALVSEITVDCEGTLESLDLSEVEDSHSRECGKVRSENAPKPLGHFIVTVPYDILSLLKDTTQAGKFSKIFVSEYGNDSWSVVEVSVIGVRDRH